MTMTPEAAQKIWLMYNDELTALPDALKMAQNSLKADQSLDRYESKTILAKILYVMWKELASDHEVKQGCNGINHENEFVTVSTLTCTSRLKLLLLTCSSALTTGDGCQLSCRTSSQRAQGRLRNIAAATT